MNKPLKDRDMIINGVKNGDCLKLVKIPKKDGSFIDLLNEMKEITWNQIRIGEPPLSTQYMFNRILEKRKLTNG